MNTEFKKFVRTMVSDDKLDLEDKVGLLDEWETKVVDSKAGCMMDKIEAEKHFDRLGILRKAKAELGN